MEAVHMGIYVPRARMRVHMQPPIYSNVCGRARRRWLYARTSERYDSARIRICPVMDNKESSSGGREEVKTSAGCWLSTEVSYSLQTLTQSAPLA